MLERTGQLLAAASLAGLLVVGCAMAGPHAAKRSARGCHRVAGPGQSVERLVQSLRPGMTGCLRGGTYGENVRIGRGGRAGHRITLRSFPGERATIVGRMYIAPGGDYVTISHLRLVGNSGSDLPSPTVSANHVTFFRDTITNDHTGICLIIANAAYTTISANRIHDCGRLPSTNHDHGIYVEEARGTRIVGNAIYDNADRGIQLYPKAFGSVITGNVIDGNGEGVLFAGDSGDPSSGNHVVGNVIANSRLRYNVESYFPSGQPRGLNVVTRNCLYGGVRNAGSGGVMPEQMGFRAYRNLVANPHYRDRSRHDFRLGGRSRCHGVFVRATAAGLGAG
jgi:parallel beta-helix repeat protein